MRSRVLMFISACFYYGFPNYPKVLEGSSRLTSTVRVPDGIEPSLGRTPNVCSIDYRELPGDEASRDPAA